MVITSVQVVIQKRPEEAGVAQKTFTFNGEGYVVSPADTVMYPRDLRLMDMLNETIKKYNGEIRKPAEYAEDTTLRQRPAAVMPPSSTAPSYTGLPTVPTIPALGSQAPMVSRAHLQAVPTLGPSRSPVAATTDADPTSEWRY